MLVAVGLSDVLIGSGTTTLGLVIGALLEQWRDDTKWKREEGARWTSDLRVHFRDLIASGDEFCRRLNQSRMLERRARSGPPGEGERRVEALVEALDVMDRELTKVLAISADVQLIGTKQESEVTSLFALQILAATVMTLDDDIRDFETRYRNAKKDLIDVARASLRRA